MLLKMQAEGKFDSSGGWRAGKRVIVKVFDGQNQIECVALSASSVRLRERLCQLTKVDPSKLLYALDSCLASGAAMLVVVVAAYGAVLGYKQMHL